MARLPYKSVSRASLLAAAFLVAAAGCSEDTESPTAPEPTAALATATAARLAFDQVSAGQNHTCGIATDSRAYCWGENEVGQLGNGTHNPSNKPVAVAGGLRFLQISAGAEFTCAIATTNKAYCWGANRNYQLGTGSVGSSPLPIAVAGGRSFRMVRAGYDHTCAVTPFDAGFCWGQNRFGELGINSTLSNSQVPVRVAGGLQWNRIVAGGHYSCGVTTDNRAYCWGYNGSGRLGDGTFTMRRKPVPVAGGIRFRLVVAGGGGFDDIQRDSPSDANTCGVATDNKGYCWGRVGSNTWTTPTAVPGTRRWLQVIGGWEHSCGVTTSNAGFCWGMGNNLGQLGNGTTSPSDTPVRVAGSLQFAAVTLGTAGSHTCGLTTTSRLFCWGSNESGQLGDGTNSNRLRPVEVAAP